ncbi:MAG: heat-inducible transcriptional repressor HrcA [Lachnospiraceae bacterium]|nr:heat-inducible transcriptional repressor HrcA [Lachnospiraceae bacterium]
MELDERKQKILQAVIANYLETGEPVGSRTISKYTDLNLSSATIRNEMADLEEMGYIIQPYTSAGRIPSDLGYRFYVDQLMQEKEADQEERKELLVRVDRMEKMLEQVATVLATNTNYATLVTSPQLKESKLKFIQVSQVDEHELLAVIVVEGNVVKNQMIYTENSLKNEEVLKLNILLNSFLQGLTLKDINLELVHTMKVQAGMHASILEEIFQGIVEAIHDVDEVEVYTGGTANILRYPELGDREQTSRLLDALVEKKELTKLLDDTMTREDKHGIQVYIGTETSNQNLKDCSVVTATYEMEEGGTGTIGIIGPKRMDYKKVVKTLKNLTGELDDIFNKKT